MINTDRLVKLFTDLVAIDSPSLEEHRVRDFIRPRLEALGFSVSEDNAGEILGGTSGNLFAVLEANADKAPILFSSHMDTVEPSRGKQAIIHPDGKITSDGTTILAADDFAGLAVILEVMTVIVENELPHGRIELLITVDEERYCRGSALFDYSQVTAKKAYVLDLDGEIGGAAFMAPTILSFQAEFHGQSAHAGFAPHKGVHAIEAATKALAQVQNGWLEGETTFNIGKISGGKATNIVPDLCFVAGEIRSFNHDDALKLAEETKIIFENSAKALGATVKFDSTVCTKAYHIDENEQVVLDFVKACEKENIKPALRKTFGGSDAAWLVANGVRSLVIANAMNACHSTSEYSSIADLEKVAKITLNLI